MKRAYAGVLTGMLLLGACHAVPEGTQQATLIVQWSLSQAEPTRCWELSQEATSHTTQLFNSRTGTLSWDLEGKTIIISQPAEVVLLPDQDFNAAYALLGISRERCQIVVSRSQRGVARPR